MRIDQLKQTFLAEVLEVRADVLTLHAEVLGNLLDATGAVCRQVYLRSAKTLAEDFLYLGEVLVGFCPKGKGVRLFDGIDLVLDLRQAV